MSDDRHVEMVKTLTLTAAILWSGDKAAGAPELNPGQYLRQAARLVKRAEGFDYSTNLEA